MKSLTQLMATMLSELRNTSDLSTTFTIPSLTPQTRVSDITVTAYTRAGQGEPANLPVHTTFAAPCNSIMTISY